MACILDASLSRCPSKDFDDATMRPENSQHDNFEKLAKSQPMSVLSVLSRSMLQNVFLTDLMPYPSKECF